MSDAAALFRARVAAALRDLPTELRRVRDDGARRHPPSCDLRALVEQLESASPGLALLMQLRARLFMRAAVSASQRGFDQVVMVGRGFGTCPQPEISERLQIVEIEHPAVLGARNGSCELPADVALLPADDFEHRSWRALSGSPFAPRDRPTLFLIEGMSLWGSANALSFWMGILREESAGGSEMLVNVLDVDGARHARAAMGSVEHGAAASFATPMGTDVTTLPAIVAAHSLELLHLFDSHAVQQAYLGFTDLLVREHYLWMRAPGTASHPVEGPLPSVLRSYSRSVACAVPLPPRLRDDAWARPQHAGVTRLGFPVTALRACSMPLADVDLAAVSLFDGRASSADIAGILSRLDDGRAASDVVRLVQRLQARGFLTYDAADPACGSLIASLSAEAQSRLRDAGVRVDCRLSMIRELAFVALDTGDRPLRGRVARLLEGVDDNVAAEHLRGVLEAEDVVLARDASVTVGAPGATMARGCREILAATVEALDAIGSLLDVSVASPVHVSVTVHRDAIPITIVAEAVPYTLVRIPWRRYSPAVLYHELTHALAMCGSRWLSEGLAVWVQRRLVPGPCFPDDASPARGRGRRSLADHLGRRERCDGRLDAADYRGAGDYVTWMVSRFGLPTFARIFDACWAGVSEPVDAVCRDIGFASLRQLEQEWRSCG